MKIKTAALVLALLMLYGCVCTLTRIAWEDGCSWCVAADTPVYIPGTADEIAVTFRREPAVGWRPAWEIPGSPSNI